ncbi:hypothetical protein CEXT_567701 [Caerostris extrusa]|uniref:Uncharacterized protein n=1 Tax=Caerostris extrusa TaxID=172846 RepID=A0AAV4R443_CAEEX|nr:hypothetical protein CEXT_567701 [Caerostris extrusa]
MEKARKCGNTSHNLFQSPIATTEQEVSEDAVPRPTRASGACGLFRPHPNAEWCRITTDIISPQYPLQNSIAMVSGWKPTERAIWKMSLLKSTCRDQTTGPLSLRGSVNFERGSYNDIHKNPS